MSSKAPIYLASPYNHPDPEVSEARRIAVCKKAGEFIAAGIPVISPIAHNVSISEETNCDTGWDLWKTQDEALLSVCRLLVVLRLPGWKHSKGIAGELEYANKHGIPVNYIDIDTIVIPSLSFL